MPENQERPASAPGAEAPAYYDASDGESATFKVDAGAPTAAGLERAAHAPTRGGAAARGGTAPEPEFAEDVILLDDRYRLDGVLGKGGMGVVYRAFDTRLERVVALKTIQFAPDTDENKRENLVRRFVRECKVVAGLNHPNLVTVYDAGASEGLLYLVMEYVQGKTLVQALQQKKTFTLQEAVECIVQVCEGLAFAHEGGVIHRDIKPANIMMLDNGQVKVMDFGLAYVDQATQLTAGLVLGTPEHMAPEQIKNEKLDHRADIFSIGIVLYTLLTGEKPFRGKALMEALSAILFATPAPPSSLVEGLSSEVDDLLSRFLAKDKNARFSSTREAAEALRALLRPVAQDVPELLEGMSFRRSLVDHLPLPLARLYSRTFNTKESRDRLSNTLFMAEAYVKLLSSLSFATYLQRFERDAQFDESLQAIALPTLWDWLGWIERIGAAAASVPAARGSYPGRIYRTLTEARDDRPDLQQACAGLAELLEQPAKEVSIWTFLTLAVTLRERGAWKDELPPERAEALGVQLFNALSDSFFLLDPLLRGQILHLGESTRLLDGAVETPRLSLQGALPLRISPLRTPEAPVSGEGLYYFPSGGGEPLELSPFLTYLEHDLGADCYFLHYDLRTGEVHYLSYNSGHRYLSMALADAQLELARSIYGQELNSSTLRLVREKIRGSHYDKLPKLGAPRGQVSGDFEILEKIGEGGMGVVYKARQLSLNRIVALKVLARGRVDDELMVARFKREVATLASCDHPNIVKILDSGFEKGEYFYAMEYIDGVTLSELYNRLRNLSSGDGALSGEAWPRIRDELLVPDRGPRRETHLTGRGYYEAVAIIGRDVASTLHHIHEMGIIHRDVKPSNVMITRSGRVVLMDFGLAKGSSDLTMTVADHALGTVRYASPEQLQPRKLTVDHRTDIYSLGCSLYEMAGLQPIFEVETEIELISKLIYEEPRPLQKLNRDVPEDLAIVIGKAMMKRAEDRYTDIGEMAEDLGAFLEGRSISARPPSLTTVIIGTVRRHKEATFTAVAAILLLVLGTAWGIYRLAQEKDIAQLALMQANSNLMMAYAKEGSYYLDLKRPMEASFSFYRALRLQDGPAIRAGLLQALNQSPALAAPLPGHDSAVQALALTHSGQIMATGAADGRIKLWNLSKRREIATFSAHPRAILALAISADGSTMASASADRSVKVWNLERQQVVASFDEPHGAASVALSPDGALLAVGGEDGSIRLLEWASSQPAGTLEGHVGLVQALVFTPDGRTLISGSADSSIKLWDTAERVETATFEQSGRVLSLSLSADGQSLAAASPDGRVRLWSLSDQRLSATLRSGATDTACVALRPDGRELAYCGPGNSVWLWDVFDQSERARISGHTYPVRALAYSPGGDLLVTAGDDQVPKLWDLRPRRGVTTLAGHTGFVYTVAVSPDGKTLASGGADTMLKLWNVASGESFAAFEHSDDVFAVAFSPDGRMVASGSGDGSIRLWDILERKQAAMLEGHDDLVLTVAFSPDGRTLASGSEDGSMRLWNVRTGEGAGALGGHRLGVNSVAFTPDGKTLVSGGDDQTIKLWDVESLREIDTLAGHTGFVYAIAVRPDGKMLASVSSDLVTKLWDLEQKQEIGTLTGHGDLVWAVAFSPDNRTLATGSYDQTMKLWDLESRREISTLSGHAGQVSALAFSPDGRSLISGSHDTSIRLWDLTFFSRPLSQILAENKQEFLLLYREARFQPRFFAAIASGVEDILRAHGERIPQRAIQEAVWKFRDTGLTPGDVRFFASLLAPKSRLDAGSEPTDLYSAKDWERAPSTDFLHAAGEYFLSKRNVHLADRCFSEYAQQLPPAAAARAKADVAMIYLQRDLLSPLAARLAQEAAASDGNNAWYQLVLGLTLAMRGEHRAALPVLEPLRRRFGGNREQQAAYNYGLGMCYLKTGRQDEGLALLREQASRAGSDWSRKAAELLRAEGQPLQAADD
jgi:WD40 repeat protein/serine/threonine protein kinase